MTGLADWLQVPFAIVFKLPIVCCDAFVAGLLFKLWSRRRGELAGWTGAALYAWALTPILVSSYHGNTDSVAAAAWLLSVYLATERGMDFAAGLALERHQRQAHSHSRNTCSICLLPVPEAGDEIP